MADKPVAAKPLEAGVYSIKGGGYRAAITKGKGVVDLGLFKTREEANAAYKKAQHDLHPVPPSEFPPGTKNVGLTAENLVVQKPTMKFRQ